ncbi:hypothetical protein C8R43DRAFT_1237968 [Mycena crocata]|nr:hypothetical protein C8R43DRAFT_1237968 [Mycena crocata]
MDVDMVIAPPILPNCNMCHRAPVTNAGYSTCRTCREKRAEQKKKAKERRRQAQMVVLRAAQSVNLPKALPAESSNAGKKRKLPVDQESAADAMDRMRKRFKTLEPFTNAVVYSKAALAPIADPADPIFEKHVNAADLHRHIKRLYPNNSSSIRFHGTYAIIAFPDIDNKTRARHVARDLRDNTNLHFNLEDRTSHPSPDGAQTHIISYKCTCRATSAALKGNASDLAIYFGSKKAAAASNEKPKTECRGRVEISVEDDRSHPLGLLGQRVKVAITHPKRV